ncbi:MAG TPA: AraC family transcriptional regulator [Acidobacteriaceae bacterium]|nr:AraC family transcriptional regulator [Acidobacteriaceae bacterium]
MDALSEMLRVIKLDSAIYLNGEFSEPWCLASPDSRALAPMLSRQGGLVIIYHLLWEGRAYLKMEDGRRVELAAGDLITLPHGHGHILGSGAHVTAVDVSEALPAVLSHGLELVNLGGGGVCSRFICGFLVCDPQLSRAFLGGLPDFIRISIRDDESGRWLENTLKFSVLQASSGDEGAGAMLTRLSELLFAETLRRYLRQLPEKQTGWLAAARDTEVGKALTLLHQRPAHAWTLAELARGAGLSRTVLAERFRHFLGEPPMTYLTRWRLRLGARALLSSSRSVAQIALDSGYESEAAFNRAFKREYGLPPSRYRKDRAVP